MHQRKQICIEQCFSIATEGISAKSCEACCDRLRKELHNARLWKPWYLLSRLQLVVIFYMPTINITEVTIKPVAKRHFCSSISLHAESSFGILLLVAWSSARNEHIRVVSASITWKLLKFHWCIFMVKGYVAWSNIGNKGDDTSFEEYMIASHLRILPLESSSCLAARLKSNKHVVIGRTLMSMR